MVITVIECLALLGVVTVIAAVIITGSNRHAIRHRLARRIDRGRTAVADPAGRSLAWSPGVPRDAVARPATCGDEQDSAARSDVQHILREVGGGRLSWMTTWDGERVVRRTGPPRIRRLPDARRCGRGAVRSGGHRRCRTSRDGVGVHRPHPGPWAAALLVLGDRRGVRVGAARRLAHRRGRGRGGDRPARSAVQGQGLAGRPLSAQPRDEGRGDVRTRRVARHAGQPPRPGADDLRAVGR